MFQERNELISLKDEHWLAKQKIAGQCVAHVLEKCRILIEKEKVSNLSLIDLEENALSIMRDFGCTPTFKNYKGHGAIPFPSSICVSVNEKLVHGVVTDYVLQEGDVVSVDLGATFDSVIADAASTYIYGQPKSKEISRLIETCKHALKAGIGAIKVGNRIGAIGNAIYNSTKNSGFGLVCNYGGHGINYDTPHDHPFVANKANTNEGIRIQPGLTIAIEPMLVLGSTKTRILDDGWTIVTENIGVHEEHTVFVESPDKVHIITELV
jgi:methionyl aminopeptidase